eukprot:364782-Chlamydomonas_euryale.AAC.2
MHAEPSRAVRPPCIVPSLRCVASLSITSLQQCALLAMQRPSPYPFPFPRPASRYLCTTVALPDEPLKLTSVAPLADMAIVHHILLFGCGVPAVSPTAENPRPVWDCLMTPVCGSGQSNVLYGWGRNAPPTSLPAGVGFSVGGQAGMRYIVAQVGAVQGPAGCGAGPGRRGSVVGKES